MKIHEVQYQRGVKTSRSECTHFLRYYDEIGLLKPLEVGGSGSIGIMESMNLHCCSRSCLPGERTGFEEIQKIVYQNDFDIMSVFTGTSSGLGGEKEETHLWSR